MAVPMNGSTRAATETAPGPRTGANIGRQSLRREVNRRISERESPAPVLQIFCECGLPRCSERLTIGAERYEETRRFPTRFLIRHGHSSEEERVIDDYGEFLVVEKYGRSGVAAVRLARKPSAAIA